MNQLTEELLQHIAVNYLPREGGFAQRLADAYLYADKQNRERIEGVFAHLFVTAYRKWAQPEGEEQ